MASGVTTSSQNHQTAISYIQRFFICARIFLVMTIVLIYTVLVSQLLNWRMVLLLTKISQQLRYENVLLLLHYLEYKFPVWICCPDRWFVKTNLRNTIWINYGHYSGCNTFDQLLRRYCISNNYINMLGNIVVVTL